MPETENWTVLIHMKWGYKMQFVMDGDPDDDMEQMAHEQARMAMQEGPYITNKAGVRTYFNPRDIHKVKVIPPGVDIRHTKASYV